MTNVDDVVAARIAAARMRIEANRRRRAAQQAARDKGLARRHAAKLRAQADPRRPQAVDKPTEKETAMPDTLTPSQELTQRILDEANRQPTVEELWPAAYPAMRARLDDVIRSRRALSADVTRYVELRRALGQLDRGTYKACTRSPGVDPTESPLTTMSLLRKMLDLVPVGSPDAPVLYRLASVVAVEAAKSAERLQAMGGRS